VIKVKIAELTGAALDWVVAKCEEGEALAKGWHPYFAPYGGELRLRATPYTPSTDWSQGGPIIERECISVGLNESSAHEHTKYTAAMVDTTTTPWTPLAWLCGSTPLIAAMRCYVASKLGDIVEIPKELTKEITSCQQKLK